LPSSHSESDLTWRFVCLGPFLYPFPVPALFSLAYRFSFAWFLKFFFSRYVLWCPSTVSLLLLPISILPPPRHTSYPSLCTCLTMFAVFVPCLSCNRRLLLNRFSTFTPSFPLFSGQLIVPAPLSQVGCFLNFTPYVSRDTNFVEGKGFFLPGLISTFRFFSAIQILTLGEAEICSCI